MFGGIWLPWGRAAAKGASRARRRAAMMVGFIVVLLLGGLEFVGGFWTREGFGQM